MQCFHRKAAGKGSVLFHLNNTDQYSELAEHVVEGILKLVACGTDAFALPNVQQMLSGCEELLQALIKLGIMLIDVHDGIFLKELSHSGGSRSSSLRPVAGRHLAL